MPNKCCQSQLHCFLGWHSQTLSSSQHGLVLVKKSLFAVVYLPLSSNTTCILIFVGCLFCECPMSEDFCDYIFTRRILSKDLWPAWVTTVAITQQPKKYYKHLLSDLPRYCYFGETLLTLSRVVDMSTIYLRRYAVGAFVAITCTNKSSWFQQETFCTSYWFS